MDKNMRAYEDAVKNLAQISGHRPDIVRKIVEEGKPEGFDKLRPSSRRDQEKYFDAMSEVQRAYLALEKDELSKEQENKDLTPEQEKEQEEEGMHEMTVEEYRAKYGKLARIERVRVAEITICVDDSENPINLRLPFVKGQDNKSNPEQQAAAFISCEVLGKKVEVPDISTMTQSQLLELLKKVGINAEKCTPINEGMLNPGEVIEEEGMVSDTELYHLANKELYKYHDKVKQLSQEKYKR